MAGLADFLRREGWRVNQMSERCPKDFPLHMGVMFLIGRQAVQASQEEGGQASQASESVEVSQAVEASQDAQVAQVTQQAGQAAKYCIAWLDPASRMQVQKLSLNGSRMEATFGGQEYRLTAEAVTLHGKLHLTGTVWKRKNGKSRIRQDKLKPGKDYGETGTWGAEGNGGGGGGVMGCAEELKDAGFSLATKVKELVGHE